MTRRLRHVAILVALGQFLSGCLSWFPDEPILVPDEVLGLQPAYIDTASARRLILIPGALTGREQNVELDSFSVRLTPYEGLTFSERFGPPNGSPGSLRVPGITRILSSSNNTLSFDNYTDSVTIEVFAINEIEELSRTRDVFVIDPYVQLRDQRFFQVPDEVVRTYDGSFFLECYDPARGFVRSWMATELFRPQCLL